MASILRQIVAGPRARHPEADLDLCYVTDRIIATSGPSNTYPQRAYRNPLDHVVKFLDSKHGVEWAIWEFRAEGTGYPDELVYNRVRHYPWPDHHPPPFRLIPIIMASMRNWLHGGELEDNAAGPVDAATLEQRKRDRVAVVHCKAGKGRSGTISCSYLISEEGWKLQDALDRFTERRMRPQFGAGVSIPSQLRWLSYVDRWTREGKKYIDRPVEIVEIHIWGLRDGVKCDVEGYVEEGKKIHIYHTFKKDERHVVEGDAPEGMGFSDLVWELAGYGGGKGDSAPDESDEKLGEKEKQPKRKATLINMASAAGAHKVEKLKKKASAKLGTGEEPYDNNSESPGSSSLDDEPGGMAVILKPKKPILIPHSDVNIAFELRNRVQKSLGMTMVTAVGHVWFNAFFENLPKETPPDAASPTSPASAKPATIDTSAQQQSRNGGVFSIDWAAMDGIKGTSRKGSRALDRLAVVWRFPSTGDEISPLGEVINEPEEGQPVPQMAAADWKGADPTTVDPQSTLGLRTKSPESADISQASSVRSFVAAPFSPPTHSSGGITTNPGDKGKNVVEFGGQKDEEIQGVKRAGPHGERWSDEEDNGPVDPTRVTAEKGNGKDEVKKAEEVLEAPDRADGTVKPGTTEVVPKQA